MKTIKLLILFFGLIAFTSAYSFTALNLPFENIPLTDSEEMIVLENTNSISDVVVSDNTNYSTFNMEDTIQIDLASDGIGNIFPSDTRECIMKQVPYPEFARKKQLEGGVAVRFQFDDNGTLHIKDACSNSAELEQYVLTQLSNLQLKNCRVEMNKDYYLRFMFRLF